MLKKKARRQYAALPMRRTQNGLQVMLITSRETRRWIIPKGWPEDGLSPCQLAAREAYEEAGLTGQIGQQPLGQFRYDKRLSPKDAVPCSVDIFPLWVEDELDDWPERGQRDRQWVSPGQAALLVSEAGLIDLLLRLGAESA